MEKTKFLLMMLLRYKILPMENAIYLGLQKCRFFGVHKLIQVFEIRSILVKKFP